METPQSPSPRTYSINDLFYSIQGEAYWTGTPCVFVRFAGCSLSCRFCDTPHGERKRRLFVGNRESATPGLLEEVLAQGPPNYRVQHVVLTGGEPWQQIDWEFLNHLHNSLPPGNMLHVETNGVHMHHRLNTNEPWLWITWSPKKGEGDGVPKWVIGHSRPWPVHEIKLVHHRRDQPLTGQDLDFFEHMFRGVDPYPHFWLQPAWDVGNVVTGDPAWTTSGTVTYTQANYADVLALLAGHPRWRLSQQTHKLATELGLGDMP